MLVYKRRGVDPPLQTIPTKVRQVSQTSTNTSNGEGSDINGFNHSDDEMDTN